MGGKAKKAFNKGLLKGLAKRAQAPHGRNQKSASLPAPTPKSLKILADGIQKETGVRPTFGNLDRVLHYKNSRHVFKEHGDPAKEAARRTPQNAITPDHFAHIPDILDKKHGTSYTGGSRPGLIHKGAGPSGVMYYVEILDPKTPGRLITMTMYEHSLKGKPKK